MGTNDRICGKGSRKRGLAAAEIFVLNTRETNERSEEGIARIQRFVDSLAPISDRFRRNDSSNNSEVTNAESEVESKRSE